MGRVGPRCCDGATHKTHAADARPEPRPCPVRSAVGSVLSLKWRRAACGPSSCVRLNFCGSSFVTRCSPTHKPRYRLKELAELFPTVYRFEGRRATGEEREQPKVEAQRRAACGPSGRHLRDIHVSSPGGVTSTNGSVVTVPGARAVARVGLSSFSHKERRVRSVPGQSVPRARLPPCGGT